MNRERRNLTQRVLMRRRRLWERVGSRYELLTDDRGRVKVVPLVSFTFGGSRFLPSVPVRLHMQLAARLTEAGLVDTPGLRRGRSPRRRSKNHGVSSQPESLVEPNPLDEVKKTLAAIKAEMRGR